MTRDRERWTPCEPSTDGTLQPTMVGTSPMSAMVYIDALEGGKARGMFQDVFDRFTGEFTCLVQLLLELDQAMDDVRSPQAFMRRRTWAEDKRPVRKPVGPREWTRPPERKPGLPEVWVLNRRRGRVATFCVQVVARQHASWQGRILWLRGRGERREAHFRSALELVGLLDEALGPMRVGAMQAEDDKTPAQRAVHI